MYRHKMSPINKFNKEIKKLDSEKCLLTSSSIKLYKTSIFCKPIRSISSNTVLIIVRKDKIPYC